MIIVNLSAIHTLNPVSSSLEAFASICDKYSENSLCCRPGIFRHYSNFAWVALTYWKKFDTDILPYKRGEISTADFLDRLKKVFPFLQTENAEQQLTDAWNAIIALEDKVVDRFKTLSSTATSENPVYFISNTNELNVRKILDLLKDKNREVEFIDNPDISVTNSRVPVEIAPNVYLCLSYRYALFKTAHQNQTRANKRSSFSTMSLLRHLVENNRSSGQEVTVVSQYPDDLKEAEKIGDIQCTTADDYFTQRCELKKTN